MLSAEIGGGNGLEPLAIAARLSLPVVDADYMGRAFPELQVSRSASRMNKEQTIARHRASTCRNFL